MNTGGAQKTRLLAELQSRLVPIPDDVTGTAAPDTYKDVPVPSALDGEWNGMCGYWFRRGVDETDAAFQRAMEGR
ncbi:hypothetical protein ACIQUY_04935 [Streptomyces sp. NPDC090231]|uniref:hypothetical protein n=1 Tax=unclassified Streptomyces TaxID=2593676 RepID=UPI0037F61451